MKKKSLLSVLFVAGLFSCGFDQSDDVSSLDGVIKKRPWPGGIIPMQFANNVPENIREEIETAIGWWETGTPIRFVTRTTQTAFVTFNFSGEDGACSAPVGFGQGERTVNISGWCGVGGAAHEIGHVLGLQHEHTRIDRDSYVTVHTDNITEACAHNFEKSSTSDHVDIGPFDIDSVMMYPSRVGSSCAIDTSKPVITWKDGRFVAQRSSLSFSDRAAVTNLYFPISVNAINSNWHESRRQANDFCSRMGFSGGILNGHQQRYNNSELVFGLVCFPSSSVDYFNIDASSHQITLNSAYGVVSRVANDFCGRKGYSGGYLNGHQGIQNGRVVLGAFCFNSNAVQGMDVISSLSPNSDWQILGRSANDSCNSRGFHGGLHNGHEAIYNQHVLGTVCFKKGAVSWQDVWVGE